METNEYKDVEGYFNYLHKRSFPQSREDEFDTRQYFICGGKADLVIETTARVIEDEPDGHGNSIIENVARSLALFNQMQHFVETGRVEE